MGLCGVSDMRDITAFDTEHKKTAVDVFVHRIIKYIGAYAGVMGGVDAITWTGGIGNNHGFIRARVMEHFKFMGAELDPDKNKALTEGFQTGEISAKNSRVRTFVIKTEEELEIAKETEKIISKK